MGSLRQSQTFFFFYKKISQVQKKHKTAYSEQKFKNVYKKHLSSTINEVMKTI